MSATGRRTRVHPETKRLQVRSLHPGVTAAEVQAQTGFDLAILAGAAVTEPPGAEEPHVLRTRIDLEGALRR